ncbi:tetratricopeptide repeat protein [Helicobacter pylori]|uniref:tetratricopeptide repeat protein n=1 Tax=Helicobacter pylori TaxID=210 RepID=UPI0039D7C1B9
MGLGVKSYDKQDFTQARKYFERACELNSGSGCNFLGFLYENGQGVEKDLIKAAYFYSKACKLGNQKACEVLKELR